MRTASVSPSNQQNRSDLVADVTDHEFEGGAANAYCSKCGRAYFAHSARREKGSVVPGGQTSEPETPKAGNGEYAVRPSAAIAALYSAYSDLLAQGWRNPLYAPKDGTMIEI